MKRLLITSLRMFRRPRERSPSLLESYQKVLALSPNHPQAMAGIRRCSAFFLGAARPVSGSDSEDRSLDLGTPSDVIH